MGETLQARIRDARFVSCEAKGGQLWAGTCQRPSRRGVAAAAHHDRYTLLPGLGGLLHLQLGILPPTRPLPGAILEAGDNTFPEEPHLLRLHEFVLPAPLRS